MSLVIFINCEQCVLAGEKKVFDHLILNQLIPSQENGRAWWANIQTVWKNQCGLKPLKTGKCPKNQKEHINQEKLEKPTLPPLKEGTSPEQLGRA